MEGSHFPPGQGTFPKIGVQFWRKVDVAGYTPPFVGHRRVKVGVDQSAVSVSRCKKVGTLQCRVLTRVYPVVTFTLYFFIFFSEKNPVCRDRTHVPTCQKVTRLPLSYRGDWQLLSLSSH